MTSTADAGGKNKKSGGSCISDTMHDIDFQYSFNSYWESPDGKWIAQGSLLIGCLKWCQIGINEMMPNMHKWRVFYIRMYLPVLVLFIQNMLGTHTWYMAPKVPRDMFSVWDPLYFFCWEIACEPQKYCDWLSQGSCFRNCLFPFRDLQ